MFSNTDKIRNQIRHQFQNAENMRLDSVEIRAGDLHNDVEFNENTHPNQMPSICNMMYEFEKFGDERQYVPPKGKGANLRIKYKIPRS